MVKQQVMDVFGVSGFTGLLIAVVILFASMGIEKIFAIPKIQSIYAVVIAILLLVVWILLTTWTMLSLPIAVRGKTLVRSGIYAYVRHPLYATAIFFLYPAASLLAKSSAALVGTLIVYLEFFWIVKLEEKYMLKKFGKSYKTYIREVKGFVPKLK